MSSAQERAAAEARRIEAAIAQKLQCRCGHPLAHHDAGECWTTRGGEQTWGETSCPCAGYEPMDPPAGPYTEQETTNR